MNWTFVTVGLLVGILLVWLSERYSIIAAAVVLFMLSGLIGCA